MEKEVNMTKIYIQERSFASCKHKISPFLQLSTAAYLLITVLIEFWWKDGKKNINGMEQN